MNEKAIELKVVLVGSVGVGKTSTILRFVKDNFKEYLETTVGTSYMSKAVVVEDRLIKFNVWDTAGQEQYHSLVPLFFRKANAVIVVYDITRQKTFEDAKNWIKIISIQAPEDAIIAITGNKADLENLREIETIQGEQFSKNVGAIFEETSAKNAKGIGFVFDKIASIYLDRLNKLELKNNNLNNGGRNSIGENNGGNNGNNGVNSNGGTSSRSGGNGGNNRNSGGNGVVNGHAVDGGETVIVAGNGTTNNNTGGTCCFK